VTTAAAGATSIVLGRSVRMRALFEVVRSLGRSESTVLITGESGTGKEITANLVHQASRRRGGPFVPVSCALFSETLIESELFGHERGAFTGAVKDRPGRFEMAHEGTLFLDDIDDVPLAMQVKLLRVLQNRTIERLGGSRAIPVNARVVAGTKRDLKQMVVAGEFREDLFYRLNVLPITLPPLRDRREDIPDLTDHFLAAASRRLGAAVPEVPDLVRHAFQRYDWPGNVRELENTCERIAQMCRCGRVGAGCLAVEMISVDPEEAPSASDTSRALPSEPVPVDLDERLREIESSLIAWALRITGGNKSRAAELLRVKRSTLGDRINRCGLGRPERPATATPA
jgi:two-component system response regulator AtoC